MVLPPKQNPLFEYTERPKKKNPMALMYALDKKVDVLRPLSDNIEKLEQGRLFKKAIRALEDSGELYDSAELPMIANIPLGEFSCLDDDGKGVSGISELVQRELDVTHVGKFVTPGVYVPKLSQAVYAIKSPTTGKFTIIDGQHTVTGVAALIKNGVMLYDGDWKDLPYPTLYVETDDLSYALRSFGLINGKGKMQVSAYKKLELAVYIVRICGNTEDKDDVETEEKVTIAQNNNCYAIDAKSSMVGKQGTFTHIAQFISLSKEQVELATAWHDKYFHFNDINGSLWFMFRDLVTKFNNSKIDLSDEILEEFAAMLENLFSDYAQYHEDLHKAWNKFSKARYGSINANPWQDSCIASIMVQLYKKLGGTHPVPEVMLDEHNYYDKGQSLIDFLPEEMRGLFVE